MKAIEIGGRRIGPGNPVFIVAELSGNHNQSFDVAHDLIRAAAAAGADAVKLQTYTSDTLTIPADNDYFRVKGGSPWEDQNLYELYSEASTPWEWHSELKELAEREGLIFFSTPFDQTSLEFLDDLDVPAYKIASFEMVDVQLITAVAAKGKPMIVSTGLASLSEIEDVVAAVSGSGNEQLALLKCTSSYPSPAEDMNLRSISDMYERFKLPIGLSDHTLTPAVAVAAVALGACIVEKHLTMERALGGPDASFSLEPAEFSTLVKYIREAEQSLGEVHYGPTESEQGSVVFRRSLFVVKDMKVGELFTKTNVRSIRPGYGMPPRMLGEVLGKEAASDISAGTPLTPSLIK